MDAIQGKRRPFLLGVPFFRAALPCLVLYAFYWGLVLNPPLVDEEASESGARAPDVARALADQARVLMLARKHQEALKPLLELHAAFPQSHLYQFELANAYHGLERYQDEAAMWELYMQASPTPLEGCPQIADAYRKLGWAEQTLKALERCYEFETTHSDSIFYLAHEYEMRGNLAKALPLYKKGAELAPRYPDLSIGLARVEFKLGRTANAKQLINVTLKRGPENSDALLVAGMIAAQEGDVASARAYLQKGARISPRYEDIRLLLVRLGSGQRRTKNPAHEPGAAL
ncbi:MAG: tetratricopeptide repeat protein [Bryobacteraceae bacterium]